MSKFNTKRGNWVKLLVVKDSEKWHYLAKTKLLALFRDILSYHNADFYFLNCSHSFRTEINANHLNLHHQQMLDNEKKHIKISFWTEIFQTLIINLC